MAPDIYAEYYWVISARILESMRILRYYQFVLPLMIYAVDIICIYGVARQQKYKIYAIIVKILVSLYI